MSDAVPGAPTAPPAAGQVFGDRLAVLQAYADLLATAGVERGLIGPRETPRLWERHLLNCAGLSELLPPGTTVADLGAGAGLPGLVLAAARPDLQVVLVEPLLRRAHFLTEAVALLDLPHATVRRARGEDLAGDLVVDAVVARAVAPLERLAGWALPLLRPGGRLLALKGERAQLELDEARPALTRLGGTGAELVTVGEEDLSTWARVVVIARGTLPGGASAPATGGRRSRPTSRSTTSRPPRDRGEGPARDRSDRGTSAADRAPGSSGASRQPRSPASPDRTAPGTRTPAGPRTQEPTPATRPSARSRRAPSAPTPSTPPTSASRDETPPSPTRTSSTPRTRASSSEPAGTTPTGPRTATTRRPA